MALVTGAYPPSDATTVVGNTSEAAFIPELWSDEIIAAYKSNLVLANLVYKLPMKGKKGDTMNIPKPQRGAAHAKVEGAEVTIQTDAALNLQITIDQHFEYSRLIEDITEVQALSSMRKFYTDDAGYQLAKNIDTALFTQAENDANIPKYEIGAGGDIETYVVDGAANAITDLGIRGLIQYLDDGDVPQNGRVLVIPPSAVNTLRGIERYVSSDFRDARTVQNGLIGTLYGVEVYVSTNCPSLESGANRLGLIMQKEGLVLAEQMGIRSQTQYKQEFLATLFTSDTLYGLETYRPEAVAGIVLPA